MPGNNVTLTIDVGLQYAAERALEHGIRIARDSQCTGGCWNANGGAIVALDARNGEVLALASNPTFDPRIFVGKPNPWRIRPLVNEVSAKRNNYPGLNRALAGVYPPGSTFKPVTAIAALEENIVLPYDPRPCTPSYTYVGENGVLYKFDNWNPYTNTAITMPIALAWSCDTYFYRLGETFYNLPHVAAAGVGEPVRLRQGDGDRARPRGERARADAQVASRHLQGSDREALEARRLDPADDRPEGHDGDAVADGPLLRDGRERRAARHAAPVQGRAGSGPALDRPAPDAPVTRAHQGLAVRSLGRARGALPRDARPRRNVDRRLLVVPGRDRGQDGDGREVLERVRRGCSTRPGGAATARRRRRDRRVRAGRERRPRRHVRRAGGARGLREVLQARTSARSASCPRRRPTDGSRLRRPAPRTDARAPRGGRGRGVRPELRLAPLGAVAALVGVRPAPRRGDHARRRRGQPRLLRRPAGDLRGRRRRRDAGRVAARPRRLPALLAPALRGLAPAAPARDPARDGGARLAAAGSASAP